MYPPSSLTPVSPVSPVGTFLPREEFAAREVRRSSVASLALFADGGIRVRGVQLELIHELNAILAKKTVASSSNLGGGASTSASASGSHTPSIWPLGLQSSSMLSGQSGSWEWQLNGSPWRVLPKGELATVRLAVSLVQTFLSFGWSFGPGVKAGRKKDDHHSFIFTSPLDGPPSAPVAPKQMFAISFPKPNIVSVIDPPTNLTPMILQAIRDAAREGGGVSEEGWILGTQRNIGGGPTAGGAYRFKLKGYTKWYRPGFPQEVYDVNAPPFFGSLLSTLDTAGLALSVSLQIEPTARHRDLWIIAGAAPTSPLFSLEQQVTPNVTCSPVPAQPEALPDHKPTVVAFTPPPASGIPPIESALLGGVIRPLPQPPAASVPVPAPAAIISPVTPGPPPLPPRNPVASNLGREASPLPPLPPPPPPPLVLSHMRSTVPEPSSSNGETSHSPPSASASSGRVPGPPLRFILDPDPETPEIESPLGSSGKELKVIPMKEDDIIVREVPRINLSRFVEGTDSMVMSSRLPSDESLSSRKVDDNPVRRQTAISVGEWVIVKPAESMDGDDGAFLLGSGPDKPRRAILEGEF